MITEKEKALVEERKRKRVEAIRASIGAKKLRKLNGAEKRRQTLLGKQAARLEETIQEEEEEGGSEAAEELESQKEEKRMAKRHGSFLIGSCTGLLAKTKPVKITNGAKKNRHKS
jgi:hypothetical protein